MRVGIIGCGAIVEHHLPHILGRKDVEVIGVADLFRNRAEETAKRFRLRHVYTEFDAMHQELNLDVVHILTPPMTHAQLAIEAMESGCHVLVEKPMALTPEDAGDMIRVAQRNNVKICIDHNFLFDPVITKTKALIQSGAAGRLVYLEANYSFDLARVCGLDTGGDFPEHWAFSLPGGFLSDHLPHPASILLDCMTEAVVVGAISKSNGLLPHGQPDELRVLVDGGDVTGLLSISLGTRPDSFIFNVYGTEMSIHANLTNMTLVVRRNWRVSKKFIRVLDSLNQAAQLLASTLSSTTKVLIGRLQPPGDVGPVINGLYESIGNGASPPVSGEAGKRVVDFINQIWEQLT
jgi:predicted dehydrogenase